MNYVFRIGSCCVLLFLLAIQVIGVGAGEKEEVISYDNKPIIKVIDSLKIDLSKLDSTICIDDKVVLSFDDEKVFACEWINKSTGKLISKEKAITVSPDSTTEYEVNLYYFSGEKIENGNFNTPSLPPGVKTGYRYVQTNWSNRGNELWYEGTYQIGKCPVLFHPRFNDKLKDHTSGNGNMMIVNGSTTGNAVVWKQTVTEIEKDKTYAFSTWGVSVARNNPAKFHFTINGKTLGDDFQLEDVNFDEAEWKQFYELWVADGTKAVISLVNLNIEQDGNDFAIDDISFASMEKKTGTITVKVLPEVKLGKLADQEKCEGDIITVNAQATGSGIIGYIWSKDGVILPEETKELLEYKKAELGHSGEYICSVAGECGVRNEPFRIDVREMIKVEKLRDTIWPCDESGPVSFTTDAKGYKLTYNWLKPAHSQGWTGGKTDIYTNKKIYWSRDTGIYTCEVKSMCGDKLVYRVLKERKKLKITEWPDDQNVCIGDTVKLLVDTDPQANSISWKKKFAISPWSYGKEFVLKNISEVDIGAYTCIVIGDCNQTASRNVVLTVLPAMTMIEKCQDTAVCEGGKAVLWAKADGIRTEYEWTGPDGFTATTAEITIDGVTAEKCGTYRVVATDSCGNSLTEEVELSFLKEYDGLVITENREVCPGGMFTLEVSGGADGLTYDWSIPDGTTSVGKQLTTQAINGTYVCKVSGVCAPVVKSTTVTLKKTLKADAGANDFLVCPDSKVEFKPVLDGTNVSYEWWKDNTKISDNISLKFDNVKAANAGIYECRVTSDCGDTILYYKLQLRQSLQIVSYSSAKSVQRGATVTLFANVSGDSERSYEWFMDGKLLVGKTTNRITVQVPDNETKLIFTFRVRGCNTEEREIPVYVRDAETIIRDTTVHLCEGSIYSYRVPDKPADWCPDEAIKTYWVYNDKDTVSVINSITFSPFDNRMMGEYVYHLESKCGNEIVRLQVDSIPAPEITAIRGEGGHVKDDTLTVCTGNDIKLVSDAKTYGAVAYEWSKDGVIIEGATEPDLTLKNVGAQQEGCYSLRIISTECGEAEKSINLKVYKNLSINYTPDLEKCPGDQVILKVHTDASVPSGFEWSGPDKTGWVSQSDGYVFSYQHSAIRPEHEGVYECRVTNVCGASTAVFNLILEKDLEIPEPVRHDTVCPGENIALSVPVSQSGMKCTWTLPDHSEVAGESIEVSDFNEQKAGVYHYVVKTKNSCFTQGGEIHLHMRPELADPLVSRDTAVCEGEAVSFVAFASGKEVKYEWWGPGGKHVEGERIDIDPVTSQSTGVYQVVVTDICNRAGKHGQVKLSLLKEFDDLTVSRDTGVCPGSDVQLVALAGMPDLVYEWKFKDRIIGHEPVLSLNHVSDAQSGRYICRISGNCQTIDTAVNLQVYHRVRAKKEEYTPVCPRDDAFLNVTATGEKLGYKWMKGEEEKGYRTSELTLYDVIPSDTGRYECRVTSLCGDTTVYYDFKLKETTRILRHSADRILCVGDEYTLMVQASGVNKRYTWTCDGQKLNESGNEIERIAPDFADTLEYKCYVEGDCGIDSISIIIRVGDFHKIRQDFKDTVCEGGNYKYNIDVVPLGAFEGQEFMYKWTFKGEELYDGTNSIFPLVGVKPEQAGEYLCEITSKEEPEKSALVKVDIAVIRLPEIDSISPDIYAVEGSRDSIKVWASGDQLNYSWKKDGETVGNTSSVWYFAPLDQEDRGDYEVTVANQCHRATGKVSVEVWKKTVIVYPQERSDSVCLNSPIDLEVVAWGEAGLLYKWYMNETLLDVPFTEPLIIEQAETKDAGTYVCVVTGRGGSDTCKIHLKVLSLPKPKILGDFSLCMSETDITQAYVAESSENRVNYDWRVEGGALLGEMNWDNASVRWDDEAEGQLTLKLTSLTTGCRDSVTEKVTYLPVPEVYVDEPSYVGYCRDTLVLERAYPWGGVFTVNGAPSDVVRFGDKNIYYAVEYYYAAENGCSATGYDTIQIAPAPVLKLADDTVRIGWCAPVQLAVSEHSEGNIVWGGKEKAEVTDATHAVYKAGAYTDELLKFWAVLTDVYQCPASDTTVVDLISSPEVMLGPDTTIGECNVLLLRGSYDADGVQKVEWMPSGKLSQMDGYTAEVLEKTPGVHTFELAVTDRFGCVGKDDAEVTVIEAPILEGKEICVGNTMTIDATVYAKYAWGDGFESGLRVISEPGEYALEVRDEYGCPGEAVFLVHALPVVSLRDTVIYEGQKTDFVVEENTDYPPYDIEWQDGSYGTSYTAEAEGYYHVKVTDNIGCVASDTAFLTVKKWFIAAPDAFLPSSSGENARFYLKEVNFGSRFEMFIYDRWGELLFKTNEIGFKGGWDGTFKGMNCQPGAYVWVAFVDGKEVGRGTLMLVK